MRIIIVSHSYAPDITPRAFRWTAIAEHWAKLGHSVDVVCNLKPGYNNKEILNGVNIYRNSCEWIENIRHSLSTKSKSNKNNSNFQPKPKSHVKRTVSANLRWIYEHTWKNIYWPDSECLWYRYALKTANELISKNDYDALVSVSDPYTSHLVGNNIKHLHGDLRWLVDIGDPFCYREFSAINNRLLYNKLNYYIEELIFSNCNAISVTTKQTYRNYKKIFPDSASKIKVIPPLLSTDDNKPEENGKIFNNTGKIRFVFSGTLYKRLRNPDYLLQIFSSLVDDNDQYELHFFGSINDCGKIIEPYINKHRKQIFIHGVVQRDIATKAIYDADILVNIGNNTNYQLPSKVVDYAATGKRVLNIARFDNDSSVEFFSNYPLALSIIENGQRPTQEQIFKVSAFAQKLQKVIDPLLLSGILKPYKIDNVAREYFSLISG